MVFCGSSPHPGVPASVGKSRPPLQIETKADLLTDQKVRLEITATAGADFETVGIQIRELKPYTLLDGTAKGSWETVRNGDRLVLHMNLKAPSDFPELIADIRLVASATTQSFSYPIILRERKMADVSPATPGKKKIKELP
jgi:hypothetical protein